MYEFLVKEDGITGEIVFHGALTIQNAISIKKSFLDAIEKVKELSINHNDVTGFDITYIQLLVTLHYSAAMSGKTIRLIYSKPFIAFVKDSGLSGYKYLVNEEVENPSAEDNID